MHNNKPTNSEVDAYTYIKEQLEQLEWNIKNPARSEEGEVYKQNEVLANNELKKYLGRDMPEAVIILNSVEYWVIEAKRDKKDIEKALDEAKNQYAKKINNSKKVKCVIISGVAGNDIDGYIVRNQYLKDSVWNDILFNGEHKNILLSKSQALFIINNETFEWSDLPDIPEEKYISSAVEINEILHNAGINKNKRARFLAGLVLSLAQNSSVNLREDDTTTLVENVNAYIKKKLRDVEKENFFDFIKLELPPTKENHIKYRNAIIETIKELSTLDIQNAMSSGKDILGEFYEKFLKYGNGAKEIGIVLTPRHVTEFAVDVIGITSDDYIFDPTCGTGGFLVAGFDYIKSFSNEEQINRFKNYHIFGIDQDDEVVALAIVNMIFRGDGRNNMKDGNCFQNNIEQTIIHEEKTGKFEKSLKKVKYKDSKGKEKEKLEKLNTKKPIITKVLMNPPFALKKGDEKERDFINYALTQMQDGGILFAIVPISVMVEGKKGTQWRKELLEYNTLLSVITFPEELFYPVAVGTVGVFIKKGIKHDYENQNVYFARAVTDGYRKKKGKRIRSTKERNQLNEIHNELKLFILNQNITVENIAEFKKVCKIDTTIPNLELVPEIYLDNKIPSDTDIKDGVEQMIRNSLSYLIQNNKIGKSKKIDKTISNIKFIDVIYNEKTKKGLCKVSKNTALPQNALEKGDTPYITTSSLNNGASGFYDIQSNVQGKCLTLALNGSVGEVFFQFEDFVTSGDNAVLTLKDEYNPYLLFYIATMIRNHKWRYNYYRKLNLTKLNKMQIPIPYKDNELDLDYIEQIVKNSYGFKDIAKFL